MSAAATDLLFHVHFVLIALILIYAPVSASQPGPSIRTYGTVQHDPLAAAAGPSRPVWLRINIANSLAVRDPHSGENPYSTKNNLGPKSWYHTPRKPKHNDSDPPTS